MNLRCRIAPHIIPSPQALTVTGMTPGQLVDPALPSLFEFTQTIPAAALREDAERHHLLQIVDGRLVRRPVETDGDWAGGLTRITSGVEAGQTVVTAPFLLSLSDGDAVEIVEK